ncbi:NAD(P)-dependent oxidoreductase [Pseudomonas sp.]|uniref:NAD-dependent epimerase/dehydratase family protein n=1 Tax=Pseudomonas sp. TaxID=306 RepID=UPI0019DD65F9|nr:NAD(P)-dependent oxidoreductase [Pseudomonas sp.]MBF0676236.1 NAD(P)-dependent oxidoreductase [Pseudomonas sp.]
MRFTILGAGGFIGANLNESLQRQGYEVQAPHRHTEGWLNEDLGNVFYCIGLTNDYHLRPFDTVEAHVTLLAKLLQRGRFERLVYLSSTRLYDSSPHTEVDETADLLLNSGNARHLYDFSKALGENLCLTRSAGRASVARLSCVYSDTLHEGGFLAQLLPKAASGESFSIDSSPAYARDYVHVEDVVGLLKNIVLKGEGGIYNVASGVNTTNAELLNGLQQYAGVRVTCSHRGELHVPVVSINKAHHEFDYRPRQLIDRLPVMLEKLRVSDGN